VEGHQWYWHYYVKGSSKYFSFIDQSYDSYMVPTDALKLGQLRLLEVDKRIILPTKTHIQVVATSVDVLHCWSVPSLGIKLDSCPGRLNESMIYIRREGVFYGQCSEICGMNHAFMPIVVKAVSPDDFIVLGNS
jgi:cytochrome c oxidase subunit 2